MRLRRLHPAGHCVLLVSASLPALPEIHRRERLVSPLDKDADKFPSRGDVKRGSEAPVKFVGSSGVAVRQDAGREAVRAEAANACAWRAWQRALGCESSLSSSFLLVFSFSSQVARCLMQSHLGEFMHVCNVMYTRHGMYCDAR